MELRFKNILMMLVPTTILSLSYFWWKQLKTHTLKQNDEVVKEVDNSDKINTKSLINEEKISSDAEDASSDDVMTLTDLTPTVRKTGETVESTDKVNEQEVSEDVCNMIEQPLDFVEPDTFDDTLVMQDFNNTSKRKRQHSSCDGDSAFVEDFSSDNVSITGSDTISNKTPTTPEHPVCEDLICPDISETYESAAPSNNFRDWFGPALEVPDDQNMFADILNWGSQPASDLEEDIDEAHPIKHENIAGVAIEKLSIVLEKEHNERKERSSRKKPDKLSPKKSPRTPKKQTPKKKTTTDSPRPSKSPKPKKSPKVKKTQKHKESERNIDKPWREQNESIQDNQTDPSEYKPMYPNDYAVIEYLIPEDMCGKVIGKHGKAVKDINEKTGAYVCIESEKIECKCVLSISGLYHQAQEAEKILLSKFRHTMKKYTSEWPSLASVEFVSLPFSVYFDVIVTAVINAGNVCLQIFDSEVDEKLVRLQNDIYEAYNTPPQRSMFHRSRKPKIGEVCISFIDNLWCRIKVHEYLNDNDIEVVFVDYGGSVIVPWHMVFRARKEFLELPAQAVSCYLANSYPLPNQADYSYSANLNLNQLVEGRVLKAYVHGTYNDIPCVELFYTKEDTNEEVSINSNLISWNLVSPYVAVTVPEDAIEVSELEQAQLGSFDVNTAPVCVQ